MPKYKYIVINQENKQLQGTIGAPDDTAARKELNELGFSVVSMTTMAAEELAAANEMPVFEFAAIDKNQKRVVGTIQAEDRVAAFKRLVSEYAFDVEYVVDNNLSEGQKEKERTKGAYDLQDMITEEQMLTKKKETGEEKDMKEFGLKQEVLKEQIDFVLNKVRQILDQYEQIMTQDTKAKIHHYVDKILRIKSSTNLDYIRISAEELLTFLQKEELFLNEEQHMQDRTKLLVEAQSMSLQLRRTKTAKSAGIGQQLRQWRQEHIYNNPTPSSGEKAINSLISVFIGTARESELVITIRHDIMAINDQLKHYLQLYIQATNPEIKQETKNGFWRLWNERKKLKIKLKEAKKGLALAAAGEATGEGRFATEMQSFTGWLLAFYLIYYFISIYTTTKDFGQNNVPQFFYIFRSSFLKYFLTTLFLFHGAISIKIYFFRRNELATVIITPLFIIGTLLILLNF
jgi:succinate dehydrogenase/fumarate reductase cytochrome b subunit